MKRLRDEVQAGKREGLRGVRYFVLDEADRMLDMGFMPQVREILGLMGSAVRQSLMFSATWPPAVNTLAREVLGESPIHISIDQGSNEDDLSANTSVTQVIEIVRESKKEQRLLQLLKDEGSEGKTLIFSNTKKGCAALADRLRRAGIVPCGEIHGNLPQSDRDAALADFTRGSTRYLVATDVAARGLDVEDITMVVCFDFPDSMTGGLEDYVHRIGRTGRAGRKGRAFTFFPAPEDVSGTRSAGNAHDLIKLLKAAGQHVPAELTALDNGPVMSSVAARAGKGGKNGKAGKGGKGGKGSKAEKALSVDVNESSAKRQKGSGGVVIKGFAAGSMPAPILSFKEAPFAKELRKELLAAGFQEPMAIQAHAWPVILSGRDCISIAKTGSGKTIAFLLPALQHIRSWLKKQASESTGAGPLALVMAPTRELASQIHRETERFAAAVGCRAGCVYGGAPWEPQAAVLEAGVELLVATPGRLAFLMARGGEAAATAARTIAACGPRKQLTEADAAYEAFIAGGGTPTRRIYSTLMNTKVLCGDLSGASRVAEKMCEDGFPLGVVEYTTLLKGDMAAGNLAGAKKLVENMLAETPAVFPDLRTANTFLRGCLKMGELPDADEFYSNLADWRVEPDAATYKIMVQAYGQGLRLKDMQRLLREMEGKESLLQGLDNAVGLSFCLAQVACLLGQRKAGRKALQRAKDALTQDLASQAEFDKLRRQELAREVKTLQQALEEDDAFDLSGTLQRTFAFPSLRSAGGCTWSDIYAALTRGFGLEQCFQRELCSQEDFQTQLRRCLRGSVLRWPRVFGTKGLPTKLEVCSGTGDWVVAQAKAECDQANWVASELRYDRVHSILTKAVLARVDNLALLAGDAGSIMAASIPSGSLANICINFPEPPQTTRNASCDEAESQLHLLTSDFFASAHAALAEGGILTIFSDNQEYTRSLAKTIGTLRGEQEGERLFEPCSDVPTEHLEAAEEMCGLLICCGCPGEEVGHAVQASSQFDRFFQHGKHTERYYLAVVKA